MTAYEDLHNELLARGDVERGASATQRQIAKAESELGPLPPDYREFLADYGRVSVAFVEVFGLGDGIPRSLDVVVVTLGERAEVGLPDHLVVVENSGSGNLTCIDTASPAGIVRWNHETSPGGVPAPVAATFSTWLLQTIRSLH
jgi:hypothetical protein